MTESKMAGGVIGATAFTATAAPPAGNQSLS